MSDLSAIPQIAQIPGLQAALDAKRATTNGAFTMAVTLNTGTLTASAPVLTVSQTWNNAAVSFIAGLTNVVDTASGAGSLLHDFQLGGVSKCSVRKDGHVTAVSFEATSYMQSAGYVRSLSRHWASGAAGKITFGDAEDVALARYAANVLEVTNGTAGQRRDLMVRALWDSGGNQVIGSRGAAVAAVATADSGVTAVADATDLATALTLVNDLKGKYNAAVTLINEQKAQLNTLLARCRATGGHGLIAD